MNERMEKYSGAFGNYCKRQNDGLICAQFLVFLFLFLSGFLFVSECFALHILSTVRSLVVYFMFGVIYDELVAR